MDRYRSKEVYTIKHVDAQNTRLLQAALTVLVAACLLLAPPARAADTSLRPPAVPLVVCDPYFSIWSASDTLAGDVTRHWTHRPHSLTSLIRVDGKSYRLMGAEPKGLAAMTQTGLEVLPTQTVYTFEDAGVRVNMTFLQPALPEDIDLMSRPVVYLHGPIARRTDNRTLFRICGCRDDCWSTIHGREAYVPL
jgi:hypothetical protein